MLLNTLKLGSMPLFHFTGSTLWAQLYPPTLFVAFFGLLITFDRVLPPPCWHCRRLLGLFFMGFPGVTDLMRYDSCEVWMVVTVVRYELYDCCHLLTRDCSGCWRLLPFSASGWVGVCLTGTELQSQAPELYLQTIMATNAIWEIGGFQDGRDWKYLVTQARQLPRNARSYTYIQDRNAGMHAKVRWQIQMGRRHQVCLYKADKLTK